VVGGGAGEGEGERRVIVVETRDQTRPGSPRS
jgi:hypothetical protein